MIQKSLKAPRECVRGFGESIQFIVPHVENLLHNFHLLCELH